VKDIIAAKVAEDPEYLPQRREGAKEKSFLNLASWRLGGRNIREFFKIFKICASRANFTPIAVQGSQKEFSVFYEFSAVKSDFPAEDECFFPLDGGRLRWGWH